MFKATDFMRLLVLVICLFGAAGGALAQTDTAESASTSGNLDSDSAEATEATEASEASVNSPDSNLSQSPDVTLRSAKPRWEFGLGGGGFYGYDYPASKDTNRRSLLFPFFIYRSPKLRFGDGGVRAVAIENPRVKLDLSVGGSLNASSDGSGVREGMPDLDFLFELGPQLEVRLFEHPLASGALWQGRFTSELRAVFSTDFKTLDSQGFVAEAGVGINLRRVGGSRVDLISALDVTFASERLQDYFYEVDSQYVTAVRPMFDARGGYLETNLFAGAAFRPLPRLRVFTGVIKGFYSGAKNEDSPLFETREQTRYALGIVWTIKSSKTMISVVDMGSTE